MPLETDLLTELLTDKHACLVRLRAAVDEQASLVETSDISELLRFLDDKQRLVARLQELESRLDPFRGQAPESRRWRTPEDRQRCARLVSDADRLYREVLEHERRSEQQLARRRDEAARQLAGVHSATEARGAYVGGHAARGYQLDLESR